MYRRVASLVGTTLIDHMPLQKLVENRHIASFFDLCYNS